MFRIIRAAFASKKIIKQIDITVFIDDYSRGQVAAATVKHPSNVKKKYLMTDAQLTIYEDFICNVGSCINQYLDIKKEWQSKKSYAYYFEVEQRGISYQFIIRVANHKIKGERGIDEPIADRRKQVRVRAICIGKDQEIPDETLGYKAIERICKRIADEDPSVLKENYHGWSEEDYDAE